MRDQPYMPVQRVLSRTDSRLSQFSAVAQRLRECEHTLRALLEPPLDQHVRVARAEDDTLVLLLDTPAWAARMRYLQADMLPRLREHLGWAELCTIKVRTRPVPAPRPVVPSHQPRPLSEATRESILRSAESLTHTPLREALLRIARRNR